MDESWDDLSQAWGGIGSVHVAVRHFASKIREE
jgi:hypothetical protein